MSRVSLGRPKFIPGTLPGHSHHQFLYVIFLYRFFVLHNLQSQRILEQLLTDFSAAPPEVHSAVATAHLFSVFRHFFTGLVAH